MKIKFTCLTVIASAILGITACSKGEDNKEIIPDLLFPSGQDTDITFTRAGGSATVKFTAGKTWTAKVQDADGWLEVTPSGGNAGDCEITVTAAVNNTAAERNCKAVITSGLVSKKMNIKQMAEDGPGKIDFTCKYHDFYFDKNAPEHETQAMTVKVSGIIRESDIVFSSSNENVGIVWRDGVFVPVAPGRTTVTATDPVSGVSASREVIVTDYSQCFGADCAGNLMTKYSRPTLCATQGQSFDISPDDRYSFHFNPEINSHNMAVVKVPTDGSPIQKMHLKYWGHGNNLSVEKEGEDYYIWAESYGNCENPENSTDGSHYYFCNYQNSESIGRIKFTPDIYVKPEDCTEHYVYSGARMMGACIDEENNQIAFEVKILNSNGWKYVRVYDLDEVKNAPVINYTTHAQLWVGGKRPKGNNDPSKTEWLEDTDPGAITTLQHQYYTFKAHDISKLTPLANVCLNKLEGIDQIQSIELSHEKIYVYCGGTYGGKHNECLVRVVDFDGKSVVMFGTDGCGTIPDYSAFSWIRNNDAIKAAIGYGGCGNGNMETEGIQVKNGNLYLGFSPVVGGDGYHMWIFGYRL